MKAAAADKVLGHVLRTSLCEYATLIITKNDLEQLRRLPTSLWGVIKDDIAKKRIRFRLLPDEQWKSPDDAAVEIVVEEPPQIDAKGPVRVDIFNYSETPPVKIRAEIRRGERPFNDREEFWNHAILPVIESSGAPHRHIHLVDQYAFHDMLKSTHSKSGKLKPSVLQDSGLIWLLTKLNDASKGMPNAIKVSITASESGDKNTDDIVDGLRTVFGNIDTSFLTVFLRIVSVNEIMKRPPGFIARRLFINDYAHFELSHGMRDISLHRSRRNDQAALTGSFKPACHAPLRQSIDDLAKITGRNFRIQNGAVIEF